MPFKDFLMVTVCYSVFVIVVDRSGNVFHMRILNGIDMRAALTIFSVIRRCISAHSRVANFTEYERTVFAKIGSTSSTDDHAAPIAVCEAN